MRHRIAICHVSCKVQLWYLSMLHLCYVMSASLIPLTVPDQDTLAGDYMHMCITPYVRMYICTHNGTVILIVLAMMYFYYTNSNR